MKKELRRQQVIKRKNFLPTLIVTIFFWLSLVVVIYFFDPNSISVPLFFILSFLSLFFTSSLLLGSRRRGFVISIGLILFLILRYFGIGNVLNLILIAGLGITIELYLARK